ncbi:MAG: SGNH/GDSL hydrolase family protein [Saccharofermentans sp.]|nr:SGNH/GDSL hydrolase family protein [Saccharofermentans sp.]
MVVKKICAIVLSCVLLSCCVMTGCGKKNYDLTKVSGKAVVLGDSLWGIDKTEDGIGGQLAAITSLEVKDYTIPGTCAAKIQGAPGSTDSMYAILVVNDDNRSQEIRNEIADADYVFIEHCNNDYGMKVPLTDPDCSYKQALVDSISAIKTLNPDVQIVLLAPTVGYFVYTDELSTEQDNGYGTIDAYIKIMEEVADSENVSIIMMNEAWTLTRENWKEYTEEGVHLTKTAKTQYAEFLATELYELFVK